MTIYDEIAELGIILLLHNPVDESEPIELGSTRQRKKCIHNKNAAGCSKCVRKTICKHRIPNKHCIECCKICTHNKLQRKCSYCSTNSNAFCMHRRRRVSCLECSSVTCDSCNITLTSDAYTTHLKAKHTACQNTECPFPMGVSRQYKYKYCYTCGCSLEGKTPAVKRQEHIFQFIRENYPTDQHKIFFD